MKVQIEAYGAYANAETAADRLRKRLTEKDDTKEVREILRDTLGTLEYISKELQEKFPNREKTNAA